jgi:Tfp pilus assembly protein PilF
LKSISILGVAVLACTLIFAAQSKADTAEIARQAMPATVVIEIRNAQGEPVSFGSGFVVDPSGLIVSSLHVFENAVAATVRLHDGREFTDPKIVGFDSQHDLIVLRVRSKDLPVLALERTGSAQVGQKILTIGNPEGLAGSVSDGIVSSIREDDGGKLYQLTAPVSPGSSGGPVLNEKAEVIGVVAFTIRSGQNLNFARPIQYVFPLLKQTDSLSLAQFTGQLLKLSGSRQGGRDPTAGTADENYRRGLDLYAQHNLPEAVAAFKKAIEQDPDYSEAYFQVGAILASETQTQDQATHFLEEGLKLAPEDSVAHSLLAVLYRQGRRYNDSISESRKAIGFSPQNPAFHLVLGITLADSQRHEEAIVELRQAIQLRPNYPLAYYHLALSYERTSNPDAAVRAWQTFLKLATASAATTEQVKTAQEHLKRIRRQP